MEHCLQSHYSAIADVKAGLVPELQQNGFTASVIFAIELALEEALSNAIKHGNRFDRDKSVHFSYLIEDNSITITIRDEGVGFDPSLVPDPTSPERLEESSGRGIFLMRTYMDEVV